MNLSYWEKKSYLSNIDFTIVGSGLVGITCALELRRRFPKAKILILERAILPDGASTKNAGFACFGSLSEIISDLETHTPAEVLALIEKRVAGLHWLRETLGDENLVFQQLGGYELFTAEDELIFDLCFGRLEEINKMLLPVFGEDVFQERENDLGFKNVRKQYLFNRFEGQLDTGKMMQVLLQKARGNHIEILNNVEVTAFEEQDGSVIIKTDKFDLNSKKLFIATNGFASQLGISGVNPARAQVLITEPIKDLKIQGSFHLESGFYYFRNIDNRILLGGGRNLDFDTERTNELALNSFIQQKLEILLKTVILPAQEVKISQRWSGIMGVGKQKKPILQQISPNIYCGVRLGGMGISIGSQVGKDLAAFA